MMFFLSLALPVAFVGSLAVLSALFDRLLDRFPGLEAALFSLFAR